MHIHIFMLNFLINEINALKNNFFLDNIHTQSELKSYQSLNVKKNTIYNRANTNIHDSPLR
jgi:hypothetical protein